MGKEAKKQNISKNNKVCSGDKILFKKEEEDYFFFLYPMHNNE